MPSFEEARAIILSSVTPIGIERVALLDAIGKVIAEDIVAPWELPYCDNSAMDGYAVRAADCAALPATLRVSGYIPAGGDVTGAVGDGCAIRIMTGAPIPPGCDAVVPVEETDGGTETVTVTSPVQPRQHIRFRGEDVGRGETVIAAGTLIPEKAIIEPNSLWMGSPGKFRRRLDEKDQETILRYANNYLGYKDSYLRERKGS